MKLIPALYVEFRSSLPKDEVVRILQENLRPKKGIEIRMTRPKNDKIFEGYLHNDRFEFQRVIRGRNSFRPQISGRLHEKTSGTLLIAEFKLHLFVLLFMCMWLGFVSLAVVGSIFGVVYGEADSIALVIPTLMLAFGIGMVYFGFTMEKEKSISELKRLLNLHQLKSKYTLTRLT